ncbi:MAG: glycosyltransferase family 2 protein [bacterium]|jgi:GT2 family glycosyltransferase|nr:glycosyltransferase family 2 protein [bacterium]
MTKPYLGVWRAENPLVSVIILNYNGARFIQKCLNSVLNDSYYPKEVLFVDNASSDHSVQMALEYQEFITIVQNPQNYGFPKGCNAGIEVARGEIIVLLNIDTAVREGWLDGLIQPMLDDPTIGMTGSKLLFLDGKTIQFAGGRMEPNCLTTHEGYCFEDLGEFNEPREVEYLTGASVAIRRELLEKVGNLDEAFPLYYDDLDLSFQAHKLGYKVMYQPQSVVLHFETFGTPKNSFKYFYKYHRGRMRFLLKNMGVLYFFGTFLPAELRWYRRCQFRQQFPPCFCAYCTQFPKAPWLWLKGFFRRRRFYKREQIHQPEIHPGLDETMM